MKILKLNILSVLSLVIIVTPFSYGQWDQISFPTTEDLYMVRFVSESTGWVVGENFVYKTTDGGNSWETQDPASGCEALYAIDSLTAIYADYTGYGIRRTTDGGTSWYYADTTDYFYYDFKFVNKLLGFAACGSVSNSDSGVVRRTVDGGQTWNTISSVFLANNAFDFEGISFIDSLRGWAVSYKGWVFKTTDGGFNWTFQDSIVILPAFSTPCRDIQFTSPDSGWIVGGIAANTVIARTIDGGQSWQTENLDSFTTCSIREIKMLNSKLGWFAGAFNRGTMLGKTTNGGQIWTNQLNSSISPLGFLSISMVNENVGYAVGPNGQIYQTINGGGITNISEDNHSVSEYALSQNYPNPFNPSTKISWQSPAGSWQTLKVFDVLGNEVATLVDEYRNAGSYDIEFNPESSIKNLASGIYFYRLQAGSFVQTRKMILMK